MPSDRTDVETVVDTTPDGSRPSAEWLTFTVNAWRGLLLGESATATFSHSLEFYVVGSLVWAVALAIAIAPLALCAYRKR